MKGDGNEQVVVVDVQEARSPQAAERFCRVAARVAFAVLYREPHPPYCPGRCLKSHLRALLHRSRPLYHRRTRTKTWRAGSPRLRPPRFRGSHLSRYPMKSTRRTPASTTTSRRHMAVSALHIFVRAAPESLQTTMAQSSSDPSTTSATSVRMSIRRRGIRGCSRAYPEPLESDLAVQVEYDMDEQGALRPRARARRRLTGYRSGMA